IWKTPAPTLCASLSTTEKMPKHLLKSADKPAPTWQSIYKKITASQSMSPRTLTKSATTQDISITTNEKSPGRTKLNSSLKRLAKTIVPSASASIAAVSIQPKKKNTIQPIQSLPCSKAPGNIATCSTVSVSLVIAFHSKTPIPVR